MANSESAFGLMAEIEALGREIRDAAEKGQSRELGQILERRQILLHELHRLAQAGLQLNDGPLAQRWHELQEQDKVTEAALFTAMRKLKRALVRVRQKLNVTATYGFRNAPVPAAYLDVRG